MRPARRGQPRVVDASMVASAFFQDEQAEAARSLLLSRRRLHAPDLIYAELANIIWKRQRRGEIEEQEATEMLRDVLSLPLHIAPSESIVRAVLELALGAQQTVYGCLYLALAVQKKGVLITGDQRLAHALAGSPLERHIAWAAECA